MAAVVLMFVHVSAAGLAAGSLLFCLFVLLPRLQREGDAHRGENGAITQALNLLAPTVFACLLTLVGTGVIYLFETYTAQVDLKSGYYNLFGVKMTGAAAALALSAYHTFVLRARLADMDLVPENRRRLPETLDKIQSTGKALLGIVLATMFLGAWLARF